MVLDIPLLLENKINKKKDILIYVESKKSEILNRLKKRKNFNKKLLKSFKKIQLPLDFTTSIANLLPSLKLKIVKAAFLTSPNLSKEIGPVTPK